MAVVTLACSNQIDDGLGGLSSSEQPTSVTAGDSSETTDGTDGTGGTDGTDGTDGSTSGSSGTGAGSDTATGSATGGTDTVTGSTGEPDPVCGNHLLETGEECDDGNLVNADGCEADCTKPACDNGIIDPQEICQTLSASYDAGTDPAAVVVARFDTDDVDDVITVSPNDNEMKRFLMGPDGVPTTTLAFVAGLDPIDIVAANVDADPAIDVIVLNQGTHEIITKLNDGSGDFGANTVVASGTNLVTLTAGQVDLDGITDLVAADIITVINPPNPAWTGPALRIFDGDGANGFTESAVQLTDGILNSIAIENLDNDGLPDFVVVTGAPSLIRVYSGSTVGNVDPAGSSLLPGVPTSFAMGHADDDGIPDAVVTVEEDTDLYLLGGDGNAAFLYSDQIPLNARGTAVTFVDLDDDGNQDLAAATDAGELHLLRRVGAGQYITVRIETLSGPPSDLGVSDFNRDGLSDIVVTVPSTGQLDVVLSTP